MHSKKVLKIGRGCYCNYHMVLLGVGQMTMFDHEGGGGQNFRKSNHVVYGWPHTVFTTILMIGRLVGSWPLRSNSSLHKATSALRLTVFSSCDEEESNRWKLFAVLAGTTNTLCST